MEETILSCPLCGSQDVKNYDNKIKCLDCNKTYDNAIIQLIHEVWDIISIEKRNDLYRQILDAKDFISFISLLKAIKNKKYFCPYCGEEVDLKCKICPLCGIIIKN